MIKMDFNSCNGFNPEVWDRKIYATRFYLPSSGAADVSPNYSASWEDTSIGSRLECVTTKISSAITTVSFSDSDKTDKDILFRQYVSNPINAQTISAQTVTVSVRGSMTSGFNDLFLSWRVYVVSNDGSTERGTIVTHRRDDNEFGINLESRSDTLTSTEVIASANDRIVIEVGTGGDPSAFGNGHNSSLSIGDDGANDLDATDSDTGVDNPWVNFGTDTISFVEGVTTSTTTTISTSTSSTTTSSSTSTTQSTSTTISTTTSTSSTTTSSSISTTTSISTSTSSTTTSSSTSTTKSTSTTTSTTTSTSSTTTSSSTSTTKSTSTSSTTTSSSTSTTKSTSTSSTTTSSSTSTTKSTSTTQSTSTSTSTSSTTTSSSTSTTKSTSTTQSTSTTISTTTSTSSTTISSSTSTTKSTSTSSTTTSSSTSTSTTTTLNSLTGGLAFGEQNPTQGETAVSWQTYSDGSGGIPPVSGNQDWGKLLLGLDAEGRSRVYDFGSNDSRFITITKNRYEVGDDIAVQYRTSNSIFNQDDLNPSWTNYSSTFSDSLQYFQVRVINQ